MSQKSPLVIVNGRISQLRPGDSIDGAVTGTVTASSGLIGGGDLSTGSKRVDLALESNASGLIFVGQSLGYDGVAEAKASTAYASGLASLEEATVALDSGIAALEFSQTAEASGNAALVDASTATTTTNVITLVAASDLTPTDPVGINAAGQAEKIIEVSGSTDAMRALTTTTFAGANTDSVAVAYNPLRGVGCIFYEQAGPGYVRAVQVQGDGIVLSDPLQITSGNSFAHSIDYSHGDDIFVPFWQDQSNGSRGTVIPVALSGQNYTEVTAGHRRTMGTTTNNWNKISYRPNGNVFFGYQIEGGFTDMYTIDPIWNTEQASGMWCKTSQDNVRAFDDVVNDLDITTCYHKETGSGLTFYSNNNDTYRLYAGVDYLIPNYNDDTYGGWYPSGNFAQDMNTAANCRSINSCYIDSIDRVLVTWEQDNIANDPGYCMCVNVSGDPNNPIAYAVRGDIVPFTEATSASGNVNYTKPIYDPDADKALIFYRGGSSSYLFANVCSPSGSTLSGEYNMATEQIFILNSVTSNYVQAYYDTKARRAVCAIGNASNGRGDIFVVNPNVYKSYSALNANDQNNFIGVPSSTVSSGDNVNIILPPATSTQFTGLEAGRAYYLDPVSGQFITNSTPPPSWSGAKNDEWRPVARALSSTDLYLFDTL